MAQPGSALAWGARGRKFESCYRDHGLLVQWKNSALTWHRHKFNSCRVYQLTGIWNPVIIHALIENIYQCSLKISKVFCLGSLTVRTMLLHGVDGSSILQRGTKCSGGGEVQRKSLQNSNTVSSNLTRYSNYK